MAFEDFLETQVLVVGTLNLVIALALAVCLSYVLKKLYIKYGKAISNRRSFSGNFLLLTLVITFIIMIIKSSLALSLGLVGALSIVRFRTAIKEPEELMFLFISIGMGLGLGAGQIRTTLMFSLFVFGIIYFRHYFTKKDKDFSFMLSIKSKVNNRVNLDSITDIVNKFSESSRIQRFDIQNHFIEVIYNLNIVDFKMLNKLKDSLSKFYPGMEISYLNIENIT